MIKPVDVLLRNALVVDGTGSPAYTADVAVKHDRINAVGERLDINARLEIDASALALAPGFIDAHTHDDRALLAYPDMRAKLSQGVTCVVTGNCGISLTPLQNKSPVPPLNLLGEQSEWRFADFSAYQEALDKSPAALNSLMLTGHTTLRVGAMGDLNRAASRSEIDSMCHTLSQCLASGSAGLSTGLAYPPAWYAPSDEVIELARVVHDHQGVYTTHMRDEEDDVIAAIEETLHIGLSADVATVISHHKVCGKANWGRTRETLPLIQAARKQQQISCDVYPYTASSTVLLPEFVKRAERVMISWSKSLPQFNTWDLDSISHELGCDQLETIARLQPAGAIYFQMCDEDLERVLQFEGAMIGSDGLPHDAHPHPRLWGTFPRVLGHYSRDRKLFSLEQAVHRMTGASAANFKLQERGLIRPEFYADLVLFDVEQIIDRATYEQPEVQSAGIHSVFVNGQLAFEQGEPTPARAGRLLVANKS